MWIRAQIMTLSWSETVNKMVTHLERVFAEMNGFYTYAENVYHGYIQER